MKLPTLIAAAAVMSLLAAVPAQTAPAIDADSGVAQSQPAHQGSLGVGDALFWDGTPIVSAGSERRLADPVTCSGPAATMHSCGVAGLVFPPGGFAGHTVMLETDENPFCDGENSCETFTFDVTEEGNELRVAMDHSSLRDYIVLYLYDPAGEYVGNARRFERRVTDPALGQWTVKVIASDARDATFRVRVALDPSETRDYRDPLPPEDDGTDEETPDEPEQPKGADLPNEIADALLPNLQIIAPYEIGFGACQASEIIDYGAQRCLRFSTGPQNVGDGPLDLIMSDTGSVTGQLHQRLHRPDGAPVLWPAGEYVYHPEHLHYHHDAIAALELLRVVDEEQGVLELAGNGPKLGFCTIPYFIAEWFTFAQDPALDIIEEENCDAAPHKAPAPTQISLARGWVDIYEWWVEGNFVEFGSNPDGLYVVRVGSNPDHDLIETDHTDNSSYTYVRVTGDEVTVLERGLGQDPWDDDKVIADDIRRPERWVEGD